MYFINSKINFLVLPQYNLKKKKKNRVDSNVNQKVNIGIFIKNLMWISLLDKL